MTGSSNIKNGSSEDLQSPPAIIITESARILLGQIEDILADLVNRTDLYPSDDEFYDKYQDR